MVSPGILTDKSMLLSTTCSAALDEVTDDDRLEPPVPTIMSSTFESGDCVQTCRGWSYSLHVHKSDCNHDGVFAEY